MKFNKNIFAMSAALTAAIAYVVCAVFVAIWPGLALQLLGWVAHLVNVEKFAGDVKMTLSGFIAGLVQIMLYAYGVAWLFARIYNRATKA